MEYKIDKNLQEILDRLAEEDGKTPKELLEQLIRKEDELRHTSWVMGSGFVRRRCGRQKCREVATIDSKDTAD